MKKKQEEAAAKPVVHGRWIKSGRDYWECSSCGAKMEVAVQGVSEFPDGGYPDTCPFCEARMDGVAKTISAWCFELLERGTTSFSFWRPVYREVYDEVTGVTKVYEKGYRCEHCGGIVDVREKYRDHCPHCGTVMINSSVEEPRDASEPVYTYRDTNVYKTALARLIEKIETMSLGICRR